MIVTRTATARGQLEKLRQRPIATGITSTLSAFGIKLIDMPSATNLMLERPGEMLDGELCLMSVIIMVKNTFVFANLEEAIKRRNHGWTVENEFVAWRKLFGFTAHQALFEQHREATKGWVWVYNRLILLLSAVATVLGVVALSVFPNADPDKVGSDDETIFETSSRSSHHTDICSLPGFTAAFITSTSVARHSSILSRSS